MAHCIEKFNRYSKVPIILLVIVSFMCLVCWTAPQAHAFTMTVTVGIVLLCTALLAAFGVSITAPNNTSAIDYFTPKILTFAQSKGYNSIEDWVAGETGRRPTLVTLFSVIGGALVMDSPIWNCLLEYTKSFVEDEDIVSNGQPVGQIGTTSLVDLPLFNIQPFNNPITTYNVTSSTSYANKSYIAESTRVGTTFKYNYNGSSLTGLAFTVDTSAIQSNVVISSNYGPAQMYVTYGNSTPVPGQNYTASVVTQVSVGQSFTINKSYRYATISSYYFTCNNTTQYYLYLSGDVQSAAGTVITPSARVIDPDELGLGQNGMLTVSGIVDTMSQEDALNHIADQTTVAGGLTATPSSDGYSVPAGSEWLFDKLTDIDNGIQNQNPHTDWIPENGFDWSFQGIWHYVEDWIDSFAEGVSAVVTVWSELPPAIPGAFYGAMVAAIVIGVWRRFFEG